MIIGMGQVPFTSINYGLDTSTEGRMIIKAILDATIDGLGSHETPIFPISIFKVKKGINFYPKDPNYDLYLLAIECCSKRMYPNFVNCDASYKQQYIIPDNPDTYPATMGCRTSVIADRFGWVGLSGKGNLSPVTINLPRIGIEYGTCLGERDVPDIKGFYKELDKMLDLCIGELMDRFEYQGKQKARTTDFMMREGVWRYGETLDPDDEVRELLKHGTISIGMVGIAECMKALFGKTHDEDPDVWNFAYNLVKYIRTYCDKMSDEKDMNVTCYATPAESCAGRFATYDREKYGKIEGVTDRDYYTNSNHVPVYHEISAIKKIDLEAPFHALYNAGCIAYVEVDGNARNNFMALKKFVDYAMEKDIAYFSLNLTLDRCPECGYEGIIGDECPVCHVKESEVHFNRIRRVNIVAPILK